MRCSIILLVLCLSQLAHAETIRLKLRPSRGELVAVEHPCGKEIASEVWRYVFRAPYIEVTDTTMLAAVGDKRREADRVVIGEPFVGFYDKSDHKTVAILVRHRIERRRFVVVELAVIVRGNDDKRCTEKWLGLAERL